MVVLDNFHDSDVSIKVGGTAMTTFASKKAISKNLTLSWMGGFDCARSFKNKLKQCQF